MRIGKSAATPICSDCFQAKSIPMLHAILVILPTQFL